MPQHIAMMISAIPVKVIVKLPLFHSIETSKGDIGTLGVMINNKKKKIKPSERR